MGTLGTLLLAASLAVATPAAAQQARVSVRAPMQQDSLALLRGELERVTRVQRDILLDLQRTSIAYRRATSEGERAQLNARMSELTVRMERLINDADIVSAQLRSVCAGQPGPDGYLGISFSEVLDVAATPSATAFAFKRYPTVIAVEPGSPAQKAGLAAGDEIVALGGHDMVSGALDVAALLKPGLQLPVRYRRDGRLRVLNVLIERRPEGFISACPWIDVMVPAPALAMQPKLRMFRSPNGYGYFFADSSSPDGRAATGQQPVVVIAPDIRERRTPVLPPTPYAPSLWQGAPPGSHAIVAGAVLVPVNEGLREGLELEEGILVYEVLRGSPALDAGLRTGDVITRVNGQKLKTIRSLMAALDKAGDSEVELQVWRRNAKARTVRLRP